MHDYVRTRDPWSMELPAWGIIECSRKGCTVPGGAFHLIYNYSTWNRQRFILPRSEKNCECLAFQYSNSTCEYMYQTSPIPTR